MLGLVIAFPNPYLVPALHLRRLSGWAKYESMSNFTQHRKKSLTWEYQWSHNNLLPGLQSFRQLRLEKKNEQQFFFIFCLQVTAAGQWACCGNTTTSAAPEAVAGSAPSPSSTRPRLTGSRRGATYLRSPAPRTTSRGLSSQKSTASPGPGWSGFPGLMTLPFTRFVPVLKYLQPGNGTH